MKPQVLARLRHGNLLTKAAYPTFVETFNWLASAFANLQGDYDRDPKTGHIHLDRTDGDHPVIRLVNAGGGGRDDRMGPPVGDGPFAIRYVKRDDESEEESEPVYDVYLVNNYFQVEQRVEKIDDVMLTSDCAGQFCWLCRDYSDTSSDPTVKFGDLEDYNDDVDDPSKSVTMLYKFTTDMNAIVEIDFRLMPHLQQWSDRLTAPEES